LVIFHLICIRLLKNSVAWKESFQPTTDSEHIELYIETLLNKTGNIRNSETLLAFWRNHGNQEIFCNRGNHGRKGVFAKHRNICKLNSQIKHGK
jgi:hypothetical protein